MLCPIVTGSWLHTRHSAGLGMQPRREQGTAVALKEPPFWGKGQKCPKGSSFPRIWQFFT